MKKTNLSYVKSVYTRKTFTRCFSIPVDRIVDFYNECRRKPSFEYLHVSAPYINNEKELLCDVSAVFIPEEQNF